MDKDESDNRFRPAGHGVQAGRPALLGPRATPPDRGPGRPLQVIYAGKAHPQDQAGQGAHPADLPGDGDALGATSGVAYLENYDMDLAAEITSGVDVWLNTPELPLEASGTSGMKAALNGVPSLSVLDGWWIEGHIEGKYRLVDRGGRTRDGGARRSVEGRRQPLREARAGGRPHVSIEGRGGFMDVMAHAIALNGSFFNTHRMVQQYVLNAYFQ